MTVFSPSNSSYLKGNSKFSSYNRVNIIKWSSLLVRLLFDHSIKHLYYTAGCKICETPNQGELWLRPSGPLAAGQVAFMLIILCAAPLKAPHS